MGRAAAQKAASGPTLFERLCPEDHGQHPTGGVRLRLVGKRVVEEPLTAQDAAAEMARRSGNRFFVVGPRDGGRLYLDAGDMVVPVDGDADMREVADLVGGCPSVWRANKGATPSTVLRALKRMSPRYDAVETNVCWPEPGEGVLYRPGWTPGDRMTGALDEFAARFPLGRADRPLLKAAVVSGFYRSPGGVPMIVVVAPPGWGKSKLAEAVAAILGQTPIEASFAMLDGRTRTSYDEAFFKADALGRTMCVFDNEAGAVRSAQLCKFVTSPTLSGAPKYCHGVERPNTILKFVTSVGLRLGPEEARRCAVLLPSRPDYENGWWEQTLAFATERRRDIATDVLTLLKSRPRWRDVPTNGFFDGWCADVVSKCVSSREEYVSLLDEMERRRRDVVGAGGGSEGPDGASAAEAVEDVVLSLAGDDACGVFHVAAGVLERFLPQSGGTLEERLAALASSPALEGRVALGKPVEFPTNGAGRHRGLVFLVGSPSLGDYRRRGGVTAVVPNPGGGFRLGRTARLVAVEGLLPPEADGKEARP